MTVHLILLLSLITITMRVFLVTLEEEGPCCPVTFPVGWMGESVEDTVGSGEKTADLGRVVIIVSVIIIMIRMTWDVWRMLQRQRPGNEIQGRLINGVRG